MVEINYRHGRVLAILSLIIVGGLLLGQGSVIKIKAQLASSLINSTWNERTIDALPVKPWPWADTWVIARINVPRLGVQQLVMKDASGESLAFGPGSVRHQEIPGGSGHGVIAGHRDTHFKFLSRLVSGDKIEIENYKGQIKNYQVSRTRIIDTRIESLMLDENQNGLTLVTCWPFDALIPGGPFRFAVSAAPMG